MPGNFVDITTSSGIDFKYRASHGSRKYLPETMGPGVTLFDYDNDGRLDLFVVNGAPLADPTPKGTIPQKTDSTYWNRLYHQKSNGTFEDVNEKAGFFSFSQGAVIWVYISEVFPNQVRAKGQSIGSFTHWFMNAIVAAAFPIVAATWVAAPFYFFSAITALQFFVVFFLYPETQGVSLEAMEGTVHS